MKKKWLENVKRTETHQANFQVSVVPHSYFCMESLNEALLQISRHFQTLVDRSQGILSLCFSFLSTLALQLHFLILFPGYEPTNKVPEDVAALLIQVRNVLLRYMCGSGFFDSKKANARVCDDQ
jgi:hypothetical protein